MKAREIRRVPVSVATQYYSDGSNYSYWRFPVTYDLIKAVDLTGGA